MALQLNPSRASARFSMPEEMSFSAERVAEGPNYDEVATLLRRRGTPQQPPAVVFVRPPDRGPQLPGERYGQPDMDATTSFSARILHGARINLTQEMPEYQVDADARGSDDVSDGVLELARHIRQVLPEIQAERLDTAVTALIECRVREFGNEPIARRDILFDLYDESIISRAEACRRGNIASSEFFDLLDERRQRR